MCPNGIWYKEWDGIIIATANFTKTVAFILLVSETKQVMTKEKYTYFTERINIMQDYIPCFDPRTEGGEDGYGIVCRIFFQLTFV